MIPSQLLAKAVDEMAKLPGIGRKTALRLCLHLLKQNEDDVNNFGESFIRMRHDLRYCKHCNNLSDTEICTICEDSHRDLSTICIVESIRDVMSIENTLQYKGLYHVLGGIISPMDGVGPSDLKIDLLIDRAQQPHVKETILALSTTMEGETTSFYLYKKLQTCQVDITTIARGVGFGDELEYTDELTLGKSIKNRQIFTL